MSFWKDIKTRAAQAIAPKELDWAEAQRVIAQYDGTTAGMSHSERKEYIAQEDKLAKFSVDARAFVDQRFNSESHDRWPKHWTQYQDYYTLAERVDVVRQVFISRKQEIVRRGIRIVPREGDDNTGLPVTDNEQDSVAVEAQKERERKRLNSIIDVANANDMPLKNIIMQLEEDACIVDEQYIAASYDYYIDETGRITSREVREFFRLHPVSTRLVVDQYQRLGYDREGKVFFCPLCRNNKYYLPTTHCPECGCELANAIIEHSTAGSVAGNKENKYYAQWEARHSSFFSPGMTYSESPPLASAWMKAWTLLKQDEYIKDYYTKRRPPKVMIVFQTTNAESLQREYEKALQQAKSQPHAPVVMAVQREGGGGGATAEVVDLMRPLEEMQWSQQRDEYRKAFGALYGVSPILQSDNSGSGGLNNDGMEFTVTNRASEFAQNHHNSRHLAWVADCLGCRYYTLELVPAEERDETVEQQTMQLKIANAQAALSIGMEVDFDEDAGEFTYSGKPELQQQPGMGGFGGGFEESFNDAEQEFNDVDTEMSGTPMDSLMLRDRGGKGFRSPDGQIKQSQADDLAKDVQRKLEDELADAVDKIRRLAKKDPRRAAKELKRVSREYGERLQDTLQRELRKQFDKGLLEVGPEFGINTRLSKPDEGVLERLFTTRQFRTDVLNARDELQSRAFQIVTEAVRDESVTRNVIAQRLSEVSTRSEAQTNTLARTYTNQFFTAGRRAGYKQAEKVRGEEFLYVHSGPIDNRSTKKCLAAIQRTKDGVPWGEYVNIIREEVAKEMPTFEVDPDAPVCGWNCRHIPVRKP